MFCPWCFDGQLLGAYDRNSLKACCLAHAADNRTGEFLHLRQGLTPGYIGSKLTSFRILFEPSGSKVALNKQLPLRITFELWQLDRIYKGTPTLRSFICQDVGEPTCPLVQQLRWCRTTISSSYEQLGIFLLAGIAMSSWRGTERSEDFIFLKA